MDTTKPYKPTVTVEEMCGHALGKLANVLYSSLNQFSEGDFRKGLKHLLPIINACRSQPLYPAIIGHFSPEYDLNWWDMDTTDEEIILNLYENGYPLELLNPASGDYDTFAKSVSSALDPGLSLAAASRIRQSMADKINPLLFTPQHILGQLRTLDLTQASVDSNATYPWYEIIPGFLMQLGPGSVFSLGTAIQAMSDEDLASFEAVKSKYGSDEMPTMLYFACATAYERPGPFTAQQINRAQRTFNKKMNDIVIAHASMFL